MTYERQIIGIGGLAAILYGSSKLPNEVVVANDVIIHFAAGMTIGIVTDNPIIQASTILGWEVIEPYIYKIKYPNIPIGASAIDTMKDIIVGALGVVVGNYLWHEMTGTRATYIELTESKIGLRT